MHTVLCTTARRRALTLALVAGVAAALAGPAGAASHTSHRSATPHVGVHIGHAVKYVRTADGGVKRVR